MLKNIYKDNFISNFRMFKSVVCYFTYAFSAMLFKGFFGVLINRVLLDKYGKTSIILVNIVEKRRVCQFMCIPFPPNKYKNRDVVFKDDWQPIFI